MLPLPSTTITVLKYVAELSAQTITEDDAEDANTFQDKFTKSCPVISQLRAGYEYLSGNKEGAIDTLQEGATILDANPLTGYAKAFFHLCFGDTKGAQRAIMASNRSVAVNLGAFVGQCIGGPPGAVVGALSGGTVVDMMHSVYDAIMHGEKRDYGMVKTIQRIKNKPWDIRAYGECLNITVADGKTGFDNARSKREGSGTSNKSETNNKNKQFPFADLRC